MHQITNTNPPVETLRNVLYNAADDDTIEYFDTNTIEKFDNMRDWIVAKHTRIAGRSVNRGAKKRSDHMDVSGVAGEAEAGTEDGAGEWIQVGDQWTDQTEIANALDAFRKGGKGGKLQFGKGAPSWGGGDRGKSGGNTLICYECEGVGHPKRLCL